MCYRLSGLFLCLLLSTGPASAVEEVTLNDSADEPRFQQLANELRCMVCQNQTIADSNAELARDFRNQVKKKINQGQSNDEIVDYMVARYGDYILYRPPFNAVTALLWIGPFLLVLLGFWFVSRLLNKPAEKQLGDDEIQEKQSRLQALLKDDSEGEQ